MVLQMARRCAGALLVVDVARATTASHLCLVAIIGCGYSQDLELGTMGSRDPRSNLPSPDHGSAPAAALLSPAAGAGSAAHEKR